MDDQVGHEVSAELDAYEDALLVNAVGGAYGRGAERGARLLKKKNVLEIELSPSLPPDQLVARAREVLGSNSRLLTPGPGEDHVRVVSVIGSGSFNLNPTVVTVTISAAAGGSRVTVRGAAKEGLLFKQRAGEKAARRIADAMA
jgi:hypothetical protein